METSIQTILKDYSNFNHKSIFYEYILNKEEEDLVIRNAIEAEMRAMAIKMQSYGYLPQQIEERLRKVDFKANIDVFELLDKANQRKNWQLEDLAAIDRMKTKERIDKENLQKRCDAKYFYRLMQHSFRMENKPFIQDEYSNPYIKTLCFFLANDARFETELGFDLNKGLWVVGVPGVGKTRLIQSISQNEIHPIEIVSMIDVADTVKNSGDYCLPDFNKILFDDVGSEQSTVNHYGTKINWFKDFMELYYSKRKAFNRLIVTTNCDFKEVEDLYGYRVRSRVREMFNVVHIKGDDRRK